MLTHYERRKLEAQWSPDDRSIANCARLIKTAVLSILVIGLLLMAATGEGPDKALDTAAVASAGRGD